MDGGRSVVGGLLPPGAVSVEVVDGRGMRFMASVGNGAYAAVLSQPNDRLEPIVCCRDRAGAPVPRPLPVDYPSVRVTDTAELCPACGAVDYEERVPTEPWRGGRPGPDGTKIPNPIVICRICGHKEQEGTFYAPSAAAADAEDAAARQARAAETRLQRWCSDLMTLRATTFPIYAAEDWPAQIGGGGSPGDQQTSVTILHHDTRDVDPCPRVRPRIEVTTSIERSRRDDELCKARESLEPWLANDGSHSRWPIASHAAITLWLAARRRDVQGGVLAAERSLQLINIDGTPQPFLTLTAPVGRWVAVRHHEDLTITVAAHDLDPSALTIDPIADPAARLLGPQPPDPDAR